MKRQPIETANQTARKKGWNKATEIQVGSETRIVKTTRYGYRKNTTGEYVPKKYLANFGWKNTYYQSAECVVQVNIENFY